MKSISPKTLLIIIAISIALLLFASTYVYVDTTEQLTKVKLATLCFIISLFTSSILMLSTNILIFKKIKQLFIIVKNFRTNGDNRLPTMPHSTYEMDDLNEEILAWAADRKTEIDRLKKIEDYRKEFLGNVSHELKTPIFNIQGYVSTLLDGGLEDHTINRDYLARAERSIDRMIAIVDDLEAISQLEIGGLQLELERFDVVAMAKDVLNAQELQATAKGIILTILNDSESLHVFADRFRIRQVFTNLIVNSIKYGKEYGETRIKFYDQEDAILIEIIDNGIGINKEHLPRLFERFYRVDKSRSRHQGGTGLGLAIVKHILEAHHQTIHVISEEGSDTVFSFKLKKG
jgi:two-component system phosphate regulon sensor histidine kinase PhoR